MNRLKLICGVSLALLLVAGGMTVWALSRRDYRVYWTSTDGTVIGGITSEGRLDMLAGASFGGDVAVTGDLGVAGTLTTESGVNWTAPLEVEGALSASGDIGFGTDYGKFTIAAATGDTAIAGTLDVTGATTLGSTLAVTEAIVLGTSAEPQTPEVDTLILWFDGTNLLVKNEAGQTVSLTSW
jgi:hypothetical protein